MLQELRGNGAQRMTKPFTWKTRYTVLAIVFTGFTVSFVNRISMSVAIPYIAEDLHLSTAVMGIVLSAFFGGYTVSQIPGGMLADKFGSRKIMTISLIWWSIFTAITGAVGTLGQLLWTRLIFGFGEGLYLGGSTKTVSVWFPRRERAAAMAIKLTSNSVGTAITPPIVVAIMAVWGWRTVFYCLLLPGIIMALVTWMFVQDKPSESKIISQEEVDEIDGDEVTSEYKVSASAGILDVMKSGAVWKIFSVICFFDITLWGFTTWLPSYLVKARGLTMAQMGIIASFPFIAGTIGMLLGGWASEKYFANNRKLLVIILELGGALFIYLMSSVASVNEAVIYETIAGGFLWAVIGAFWSLPMNIIPPSVMGTGAALVNTGAQLAAFLSPMIVGFAVQSSGGSFGVAFLILTGASVISALIALTIEQ